MSTQDNGEHSENTSAMSQFICGSFIGYLFMLLAMALYFGSKLPKSPFDLTPMVGGALPWIIAACILASIIGFGVAFYYVDKMPQSKRERGT